MNKMVEIKRVRKFERLAQITTDRKITVKAVGGGVLGMGFSWTVLNFIIGLFVYGDFMKGVMLGVFAFVSGFIASLYFIPILGIILWIFGNFFWNWGIQLTKILELDINWAVNFAWWLPSILYFIIGIIINLLVAIVILNFFVKDSETFVFN